MEKSIEIKKIGIIAGSEMLPRHVVDACIKKGVDFMLVGLAGQTTHDLFKDVDYETYQLHQLSKILKALHANKVSHIVFAGKVKRTSISKLLLDIKGAKLFAKLVKAGINDNAILTTILKFFESEGFQIISPNEIATDIVIKKGLLTKISPKSSAYEDIKKGLKILKGIAEYDVGQALVIQGGLVLGVEAAEGTDELIKRCGIIQQKEDVGGILIKVCKPKQDKRVDLPCIGPTTIEMLSKHGLTGIAIEAGAALIIDQENTVKAADEKEIFIIGL